MGTSSDGILAYGIDIGEDIYEKLPFLFDEDKEEQDDVVWELETWWLTKNNLTYDSYDERYRLLESNPLPIEIVNYCSYDCPHYILAVPGMTISTRHTCEVKLQESQFTHETIKYIEFLRENNIFDNPEPKWLLASMYG